MLRWESCQNSEIFSLPVKMMCDTTNRSFRTQLAAVLDKLTKAALVEIGNLADECSSVLHAEISLHKTENEALKKRCYSLEVQLRAAREAQTYPAHVNCVGRRHPAGQDGQKLDSRSLPGCRTGGSIGQCYGRLISFSVDYSLHSVMSRSADLDCKLITFCPQEKPKD